MSARQRVLVTGASGCLGPAVVAHLTALGWTVRTLSRRAHEGLFPNGTESIRGDITDRAALRAATSGVSHIVHLAGLLHVVQPPPGLVPEYRRVNVEGTSRLIEEAAAAGVDRLVFASTVCVYGSAGVQPVTEDVPAQPDTLYGETKLQAERLVLEASAPASTVLRLAAVYGTRMQGNYRRLLGALAARRFVSVGAGTNHRALIYESDAASGIAVTLSHADAAGRIFNVSDGVPHTMHDILRAMAGALGVRPPRYAIPARWARIATGVVEDAATLIGARAPFCRATVDKFTEDLVIDSGRIGRDLGFAPRVGLDEGWRRVVAALRRDGHLASRP